MTTGQERGAFDVADLTDEIRGDEHRIDADASREVVRIHARYDGRGPTGAKAEVFVLVAADTPA